MSLGVPPVENEAKFNAWKEQAPARLKEGVAISAQGNAATSQPSAQPKDNANAETATPEAVKAAPVKAMTAIDDETTQRRPDGGQKSDTAKSNETPKEAHGLNVIERSIEPSLEKDRQKSALASDEEAKRLASLQKADADKTQPRPQPATDKKASGNTVESDGIFTASQADIKPLVPQDIEKHYLRVGGKFYHPKNTGLVAFEDKGNKLETRSNSEHIAESMVRIAEARGWDEIKVSGSETFRREVWLEAASRGMEVKGYSPSEQDKAQLAKRASERPANNLEKKAQADGLDEKQRAIVSAIVREFVASNIERGHIPNTNLREDREVTRSRSNERDYSR